MRYFFLKQNRIRKKKDFKEVYSFKKKIYTQNFIVYFKTNKLNIYRLGISVKKTIVKNATDRNRIKRLIREEFRINKNRFKQPIDIIFVVRGDCSNKKNQEIYEELKPIWNRFGTI